MHTKVSILIQFKGIKPIRRIFPLVSKIILPSAATYCRMLRQTIQNTQATHEKNHFHVIFTLFLFGTFRPSAQKNVGYTSG